jgi:hypothetical protein
MISTSFYWQYRWVFAFVIVLCTFWFITRTINTNSQSKVFFFPSPTLKKDDFLFRKKLLSYYQKRGDFIDGNHIIFSKKIVWWRFINYKHETLWPPKKYKKILNSHLFWLNSHLGRACLVLRACRSAAFLDHDAKKGCEFKIFQNISCIVSIYTLILFNSLYLTITWRLILAESEP